MFTARYVGPAAMFAALASFAAPADAVMVSYYLNQTNVNPTLADGVNYARVDIDDNTPNEINFTVTLLGLLTPGDNFGIQEFVFNVTDPNPLQDSSVNPAQWELPLSWAANVAPPQNQADGFGKFDVSVGDGGSARSTVLSFALIGTGLSLDRFATRSDNPAAQGNVLFGAHVAGFTIEGSDVTSAYFGGPLVAVVPLPATLPLVFSGLMALVTLRRRASEG